VANAPTPRWSTPKTAQRTARFDARDSRQDSRTTRDRIQGPEAAGSRPALPTWTSERPLLRGPPGFGGGHDRPGVARTGYTLRTASRCLRPDDAEQCVRAGQRGVPAGLVPAGLARAIHTGSRPAMPLSGNELAGRGRRRRWTGRVVKFDKRTD